MQSIVHSLLCLWATRVVEADHQNVILHQKGLGGNRSYPPSWARTTGWCCAAADCALPKSITDWVRCVPRTPNDTFVFGITTGHSGSASLSWKICYKEPHAGLAIKFEAEHKYTASSQGGLKEWYGTDAATRPALIRFVNETVLPDALEVARTDDPSRAKTLRGKGQKTLPPARVHMDLGHHTNLGILEAAATLLAPSRAVAFVRVIRHRYDTVRSFLSEGLAPCGRNMWTLCPTLHNDIVLRTSRDAWRRFDDGQRNLWFVDEVEARWRRTLAAYPDLPHTTVHWCTGAEFMKAREAVADFLTELLAGDGRVKTRDCKTHKHNVGNKKSQMMLKYSDEIMAVQDAAYDRIANYSAETLRSLRAVRRPHDCPSIAQSPPHAVT